MMELGVDNREPSIMIRYLRINISQYNIKCRVFSSHFPVCDYIIRGEDSKVGNVGIERKSKDDYVSSIADGRLFRQVIEMYENGFSRVIILIEGDINNVFSQMSTESKLGALGSLMTKYGVSIYHSANKEESAYMIVSILKHSTGTIDFTKLYKPIASTDDREIGAISCAEGWGYNLSKKARKYYTIRDISNIRDPTIVSNRISGVGPTKSESLVKLFTGGNVNRISEIDMLNFKWYLSKMYKYVKTGKSLYKKELEGMLKEFNRMKRVL